MMNLNNINEIAEKELAWKAMIRSNFYKLFSLAFKEPDLETLKLFTDYGFLDALENELRLAGIDADTNEWRKFIKNYNGDIEKLLYDMHAEYTKHFIVNNTEALIAPPFESFYKEGILMGKSAIDARMQYAKENLEISIKTLPDHIALEFEFMSMLCEREMYSWKNENFDSAIEYLKKEKYFLENHLDWISPFSNKISMPWKFFAELSESFIGLDLVNVNLNRNIIETRNLIET